jgi:hypothetical protein
MPGLPGGEVRSLEALGEPFVYCGQHLAGFYLLSLLLPESAQARGSAQFPRLRLLLTRDCSGGPQGVVCLHQEHRLLTLLGNSEQLYREFSGHLRLGTARRKLPETPAESARSTSRDAGQARIRSGY